MDEPEIIIKLRQSLKEENIGGFNINQKSIQLILEAYDSKQPSAGALAEDKFFELLKGYHGGNPEWWSKELQMLWDKHFCKFSPQPPAINWPEELSPREVKDTNFPFYVKGWNACLSELKRMNPGIK